MCLDHIITIKKTLCFAGVAGSWLQPPPPPPCQLTPTCNGYHPFSYLLTFLLSKGWGVDAVKGWYSLHIFILQIMFKNKDEEEDDDPTPSQNRLYKEQQGYYSQQEYYRQTILLFVYNFMHCFFKGLRWFLVQQVYLLRLTPVCVGLII